MEVGAPVRDLPVDVPARPRARLMRYELRDYQRDAALEILKRLQRSRRDWAEDRDRSSFALSAITGSGKTVIATAVIEAMLLGSTDLGVEPDPRRHVPVDHRRPGAQPADPGPDARRVRAADPVVAREVDEAFPDADLAPGRVYFLNTQKLSKTSRLAQGGTNVREYSFWDILRNTIQAGRPTSSWCSTRPTGA